MSLRSSAARGPLPLTLGDIGDVNRVFSDAFTDRYHRDGMTGVRVPELNPTIWKYAIGTAGDGAMLWRDSGGVAGFNLVHHNGVEGWMGPLAVRPDCQGAGLGRAMVTAGVELLQQKGCRTIGLETMPRTIGNIGFYSRLGFRPGHLTISVGRELNGGDAWTPLELASTLGAPEVWLEQAHRLTDQLLLGLDFRKEMAMTAAQALGDVTVLRTGDRWRGLALWHGAPLSAGRPVSELRVLKIAAVDLAGFRQVVIGVLAEAERRRVPKVSIRCQTAFRQVYTELIGMGFQVQWTDLRMVLGGHEEQALTGGVLLSNWEI